MEPSGCSSSSNQMGKRTKKTESSPRLFWTRDEESALIDALKMLRATGWKCDGSFKGGYMVRLEKVIREKYPTTAITAKHIKSKMQVWKKDYGLILGVLGSSGGTGASFDTASNMIIAQSDTVWTEYTKVYSGAAKLRGRPFPLYLDWVEIFGIDRAQGTGAVDVGDALTDLLYSTSTKYFDSGEDNAVSPTMSTPLQTPDEATDDAASKFPPTVSTRTTMSSSSGKQKRKGATVDDIQCLVGKWMDDTSNVLGNLVGEMKSHNTASRSSSHSTLSTRTQLYDTISELSDLTIDDRITATHILAGNESYMEAFWGMDFEARSRYIRMLVTGRLTL